MTMRKTISIFKAAVAVMAFCSLILSSCEKPEEDVLPGVSVKKPVVSSAKGQQFVSVRCDGEWTLSLVSEAGAVDWARLNVTAGTGSKSNVVLSYDENDSEESRELRVVISCGARTADCSMRQDAGSTHPLAFTGWMELPSLDNADLGYYSHSFVHPKDNRTYRNYSFGWSQKDRVAFWVAYPLCSMYMAKNVNRTDEWAYDPLLKKDSSAPFSNYGRSTPTDKGDDPYARGHQLPSADRLCCREANVQTFYGTNMTPQLFDHNGGIWSDLEGKVRNIAGKADTVYVVTGCIVKADGKVVYDSDGQRLAVPVAYYKALLRYSKAATYDGQWNAAAFYLEHRPYSEKLGKQHSMSIDALEEITGIDFFVNLPAMVGEQQAARLEAADPADSDVWW